MISQFRLERFPPGVGPDPVGHVYGPIDIANFEELWFAGAQVFTDCCKSRRIPGWTGVGLQRSIGLFMWAENSDVDRWFQYGYQVLAANTSIDSA